MTRVEETDKLKLYLKDNIIYGEFKIPVQYDLALAKQAVELRHKVSRGETYHLLFDVRRMYDITKAARDYLSSDHAMENVSAGAVVIDSVLGKIIVQLFLVLNKPARPLKFFNKVSKARKWLEKHELLAA